jgi:hypothetical protein
MLHWLVAFAFTQVVEVPIYLRATRRRPLVSFGASAITHPIVWFVIPNVWRELYLACVRLDPHFVIASPLARYACMVALAETFAIGVEAAYLHTFAVRKPLVWALVANGASVTLGLASRALFGWP